MLFVAVAGALAWATGELLWYQLIWTVTFLMAFTLNPVFKLDGYWLLVDLSGLRNLHRRVIDLLAYPFRRLRGRPAPLAPLTAGRWLVLVLYVVFSLAFYLFAAFVTFVILHGASMLLPGVIAQSTAAFSEAWGAGHTWQALAALGPLLRQVVWPVLVVLLLSRWLWRMMRNTLRRRPQTAS